MQSERAYLKFHVSEHAVPKTEQEGNEHIHALQKRAKSTVLVLHVGAFRKRFVFLAGSA
jgi:hypothetical protein